MEHITVGRKHNEVKVAFAECVKNGSLKNIDIKGKCFLLIILLSGKLEFKVGNENNGCNPSLRITAVLYYFRLYNKCWGNQVEPTKKK